MSPAEVAANGSAWPLVTIVTPTYNQADYLAETIESVLAQDYPNIEYIVIDDGSTDQTREILKTYDGRIRWESQENMGQAATLNKGWAMGEGEIIGYLSSDDLLKPNAVTEAVRCLRDHPEVVLVYPDFELIDATGRLVRILKTPDFDYKNMVVNLTCYPGPGAYFRKDLFLVTGGWNCKLRQIPDLEFWIRLSQHGEFERIPIVLASSRIHEASQSFRSVSMGRALEPVAIVNNLLNSDQLRLDEKGWAKASMASAQLLSFRLLWRSGFYSAAVQNLVRAIITRPASMARLAFWRTVVSALAGKAVYRLLFRTGCQGEL
jgi:glycosyltransferase involved in cell wall biosynthesis